MAAVPVSTKSPPRGPKSPRRLPLSSLWLFLSRWGWGESCRREFSREPPWLAGEGAEGWGRSRGEAGAGLEAAEAAVRGGGVLLAAVVARAQSAAAGLHGEGKGGESKWPRLMSLAAASLSPLVSARGHVPGVLHPPPVGREEAESGAGGARPAAEAIPR